jgi:phosphate:Na+ symporter
MTIVEFFTLLGGLSMFLFGMRVMGDALEKRAGNQLKSILEKLTSSTFKGFLLGLGVTLIIQSSSATTVMVVGFVNSGLMTLHQATGVIMGANLGTSVTAWLLSTSGIQGEGILQLFKPESFAPLFAFIGIILYMFQKNRKRQDIGLIFIGFGVLMIGMELMADAVKPLADSPTFQSVLLKFANPIIGVLVGTIFTAVIQSSSASVGILQAFSLTGVVSYSVAIPIIVGQNIGTCVSAMISSIGAGKNARRASFVHLYFNIIAAIIILPLFYLVSAFVSLPLETSISPLGIAIVHTGFKLIALCILMPASRLLEKLAMLTVPDGKNDREQELLDDRLLATPAVAIERARIVAHDMAKLSVETLRLSMQLIGNFNEKTLETIYAGEERVDKYEDMLGTYLVKISSCELSEADGHEAAELLHIIGDFERISDHAVNIAESAQEMSDKKLVFSEQANKELAVMIRAVDEIMSSALRSFCNVDMNAAFNVEPLEEVIDLINARLKKRHVARLQRGECTIELGFVLADLLTNLERVSDHCSNIAGCMIEIKHDALDVHEYMEKLKTEGNPRYTACYEAYKEKYALPPKPQPTQAAPAQG